MCSAARGHVCLTQLSPAGRSGAAARRSTGRAARFGLTPLATGDVLYHHPDRRMLQDVVTAIREKCTIDELGFRRERNADRHLKPPDEDGAAVSRTIPHALARGRGDRRTLHLLAAASCAINIPKKCVMSGAHAAGALAKLAWRALKPVRGAAARNAIASCSTHELELVGEMGICALIS